MFDINFFLFYLIWFTFFRWGDWLCITNSDNNHAFKPICQKDKDAKDFGGKDTNDNEDLVDPNAGNQGNSNDGNDDDEDDGGNTLADQLSCFDENVIYKAPKNNRYFFGIHLKYLCERASCAISNYFPESTQYTMLNPQNSAKNFVSKIKNVNIGVLWKRKKRTSVGYLTEY